MLILLSDSDSFYKEIFNPESIIRYGGLLLLLFVVFAETGLFIGFFLPGDSLLFTAGILAGTKDLDQPLWLVVPGLIIAATAGNWVGYEFGRRAGPTLFKRDDTIIFKKRYVILAKEFYDKYGGAALIAGRFLPIIRTFAPIVAGVVKMKRSVLLVYSVLGAILWVCLLTIPAYYLSARFPWVRENLSWIVIGMIVITTVPIIWRLIFQKRSAG